MTKPLNLSRIISSAEFRNISWMVADRLWRMIISLVVGMWMIRYLGPDTFGVLSYVLAFSGIAAVVASFGMEGFLVKELVAEPEHKLRVLHSALRLRLSLALFAAAATLLFLWLSGESSKVLLIFLIVAPQLFSSAFAVVDLAYQAELRSKTTVIVRNLFFVGGAVLKLLAIVTRQDIYVFAALTILDTVLSDVILFYLYKKKSTVRLPLVQWQHLRSLSVKALPFLVSNITIVLYMKVDQILLGKLATAGEVGVFSAATKVSEVFYFIPLVITGSLYNVLISSRKESAGKYMRMSRLAFYPLIAAAILISLVVYFFSDTIVHLLFGPAFAASGPVLQAYIWSVVFIFAGVAFNQLLVVEDLQRIIMYKTLIGVILNIALNFWLIPRYGAWGAAIATVVTHFVTSVGANYFFKGSRGLFNMYFNSTHTTAGVAVTVK